MGPIEKLVANFINQHKGAFNCAMVCSMCGLSEQQVRPILKRYLANERINSPERGLYLRKRHDIMVDSSEGRWIFSTDSARDILDVIECSDINSARKLGAAIGYSRQYAFKYLETLATTGCIGFSKEGKFVVIHRDLTKLGLVEKGIIGRMKAEVGYR